MRTEPIKRINIPLSSLIAMINVKLLNVLGKLNLHHEIDPTCFTEQKYGIRAAELIKAYLMTRFFNRTISYTPQTDFNIAFFRLLNYLKIDYYNHAIQGRESTIPLSVYLIEEFQEVLYLEFSELFERLSDKPNSDGRRMELLNPQHEYTARISGHGGSGLLTIENHGDYRIRRYMELVKDGIIEE